jgi:hypothetical protein
MFDRLCFKKLKKNTYYKQIKEFVSIVQKKTLKQVLIFVSNFRIFLKGIF